jgi:PAS domain S-box-containing protein
VRHNTHPPVTPASSAEASVFETMAALCPLGLMLSRNRRIAACNERFASMFGYSVADMLGQGLALLYPSEDEYQRIGQRGLKVMAEKGAYQDERLMRRRDGLLQWFRVHGSTADLSDPFGNACWVFEPLAAGVDASRLSPREREVLADMSRGLTAKEAAREMGVSPRTVEKLRASLRIKYGAHNAAELMSRIGGLPS